MGNFLFAVNIWIKTIIINMVLIVFGLIFAKDIDGLPYVFVLLIAAVLFTAPLLIIITQLVRISVRIPYIWQAKLAWLSFMLALLSISFYVIIGIPTGISIFEDNKTFSFFSATTMISIFCATKLSKRLYQTLNRITEEQRLI